MLLIGPYSNSYFMVSVFVQSLFDSSSSAVRSAVFACVNWNPIVRRFNFNFTRLIEWCNVWTNVFYLYHSFCRNWFWARVAKYSTYGKIHQWTFTSKSIYGTSQTAKSSWVAKRKCASKRLGHMFTGKKFNYSFFFLLFVTNNLKWCVDYGVWDNVPLKTRGSMKEKDKTQQPISRN